ncbi:MAG: inositol-3-phosphate synthase [Planctomycetota bacterium]|jgi:myo-inositol-1-phosphate synthase
MRPPDRLGVWIFGALGGLATTLVVGSKAIGKGKASAQGLLTETDLCKGLPLVGINKLVFGGHELRRGSLLQSAREIHELTGTIPYPLLNSLKADLDRTNKEIKAGTAINAGRSIQKLAERGPKKPVSLQSELARLQRDIKGFMKRNRLSRCVCVNLTSTEPQLKLTRTHQSAGALDKAIAGNKRSTLRPSTLYALAAARLGLPFIHFTPSNAALIPAVVEEFDETGVPYMGSDGKTGETLVKSALAPMFKYRNLKVLTWQGYNILGDRDGVVLADAENKRAKLESKDALLSKILGYPLHTHVGIDYVPSLNDLKTAWDFIHFQGFLDYKMSLQFTWQGCDAILAAPIVLDMIRMAELAQRRGESGPMRHLSCFFKRPRGVEHHDLHLQWHLLTEYVQQARG